MFVCTKIGVYIKVVMIDLLVARNCSFSTYNFSTIMGAAIHSYQAMLLELVSRQHGVYNGTVCVCDSVNQNQQIVSQLYTQSLLSLS